MDILDEITNKILENFTGEITQEDKELLNEWLESDYDNILKYRSIIRSLRRISLAETKRMRENNSRGIAGRIKERIRFYKRRNIVKYISVAACSLLMLGMILFIYKDKLNFRDRDVISLRENADVRLVLSDRKEISLKIEQHLEWINDGDFVVHQDSVFLDYSISNPIENISGAFHELIVPKSGEYRLRLSDGSLIILNSQSRLRFPVQFFGEMREVYLEGEAYFEVVRDDRPFVVYTREANLRVLGTTFNISEYDDDGTTEITLIQGSVQVQRESDVTVLNRNEQWMFNHLNKESKVIQVNAENIISWTTGLLRFDNMSMEKVLKKLGRWYDVEYEFMDMGLKELRFTGAFKKYDVLERTMEIITRATEISFIQEEGRIKVCK